MAAMSAVDSCWWSSTPSIHTPPPLDALGPWCILIVFHYTYSNRQMLIHYRVAIYSLFVTLKQTLIQINLCLF